MFFKTYQKLLGASCLALYLAGCGGRQWRTTSWD